MKQRTYLICIALVAAGLILALGFGLTTANMIVPVVAVVAGVAILALCRRNVTEVTEDELSTILHGKAALSALEVTIIVAAIGFAVLMTFSFGEGCTSGIKTYDNGSIRLFYGIPDYHYESSCFIPDPAHLTFDDLHAIETMFAEGHRIRDTTRAFGAALGMVTVLLAVLYGAFLWYYNRKYGA
ncbi:DUF2178 domain-containing protein [Methanoculleus chikugoensis]|uniref:Uncharacterized protein n=1 Tax=Methanoculleus chikugoensis TaxID=118126 RepID=A0ABN5XIP9_9EURY|nr:DUF2178 domain-containing protein [Methanoculleus chikugoensis]BBL68422.1 hypothetical protein MchiMG62_16030 [Methanoculleus chikugoensis]